MSMKRVKIILFIMLATCLFMACSSDDDIFVTPVVGEVNVLLIQSDNGKTSTGTMYKSGEMYNPPHGYLGRVIRYNDGNELTVYHMNFGANIKGSDVFNILNISLESNQPMSFNNLKAGDTFDSSQFHATAAYTPTWTEAIMRVATVLSGKITVVGTRNVGDKSYMTLRLTDLRFDAIDHTCIYAVNGTIEYEIYE